MAELIDKEYGNTSDSDLTVVSALPSLYPLQPFEEEAIHRVVASVKEGVRCSEKLLEEVIHCEDCKFLQCNIYTEGYYCSRGVMPNNRNYVTEKDFCSLAEAREVEDKE